VKESGSAVGGRCRLSEAEVKSVNYILIILRGKLGIKSQAPQHEPTFFTLTLHLITNTTK
jgi:hypothetical protein